MDESGHSGDTGAAEGGNSADSRERARVNGWVTQDSPWSNAGAALDTENDVPAWRRPTPFPRNLAFPPIDRQYDTVQPAPAPLQPVQPQSVQPASAPPVPAPAPPGFVDARPAGEIPPSVESSPADQAASRWADTRPRYSDLLAHLTPPGTEQARPPAPRTEPGPLSQLSPQPPRDLGETTGSIGREAGPTSRVGRPTSLGSVEPISPYDSPAPVSPYDPPTPSSAPPYPYEGDLEDTHPAPPPQQRAAVPLVRPAAPAALRADWAPPEPPPPPPAVDEHPAPRPSYDPSFPRRLSYEPGPAAEPSGYQSRAAYAAFGSQPPAAGGPADAGQRISPPADPARRASGLADPGPRVLPQRVPAQPDVPRVPEPPLPEPTAETPALARIATHLRRGDVQPRERQEGFDVQAILAAVRGVDGVRDASLRSTPSGAHSLRLDLAEGADPAEVSRRVARLLQERMGLDAAMKGDALMPPVAPPPLPPPPPPVAPISPSALVPTRPRSAPPAPAPPPVPIPAPASASVPVQAPAPVAQVSAPPVRPAEHARPEPEPPRLVESRPIETEEAEVVPAADHRPPRPLYPGEQPGPRIVIENVHVNTFGTDATVEVRLGVGGRSSSGSASGPSVDGYLLRLCATATAGAVDELLANSDHPDGPARCFVEHAAAVPFGNSQVAVVVLLLSCNGWVEQLAGSAVVTGDDRHAMVRATLAAVNRRLEALLSR